MNTKTRIKELIDNSSNIGSVAELERKLNIANGTINKWDKARPSVDVLSKVADYFKVSVDYLLCRTEEPSTSTSNGESEIELRKALENVMSFDGEELTENDKDAIIAYMMGRKGK